MTVSARPPHAPGAPRWTPSSDAQGARPAAESSTLHAGAWPRRREQAIAAAIGIGAAVLVQMVGGAYASEFGNHPDEAGHYTTALVLRDYLAAGLPPGPVRYAEQYYLHYPNVAVGHWPPLLYGIALAWSVVAGLGRASVLGLVAVFAGIAAAAVYALVRRAAGRTLGVVAASVFLLLPTVREQLAWFGADLLVTALAGLALVALSAYWDTQRRAYAVWFGVLTGAAILAKGNAWSLVLLAGFALLVTRRFALLRRADLWLGGVVAAVLALPWQLVTARTSAAGFVYEPGLPYMRKALTLFTPLLLDNTGWLFPPLVAVGLVLGLRQRRAWPPVVALSFAAVASVFVFILAVPAGIEARYLLPSFPGMLVLGAVGLTTLGAMVGGRRSDAAPGHAPQGATDGASKTASGGRAVAIGAGALAVLLLVPGLRARPLLPTAPPAGYADVARALVERTLAARRGGSAPDAADAAPAASAASAAPIIVVSSERLREGALVAEVASRDPSRPSFVVLRGVKALARADWNARGYELRYPTPDSAMAFLASLPVDYLVIDEAPGPVRYAHHAQLHDVVRRFPQLWRALPGARTDGAPQIATYQYVGPRPATRREIEIETSSGRVIRGTP